MPHNRQTLFGVREIKPLCEMLLIKSKYTSGAREKSKAQSLRKPRQFRANPKSINLLDGGGNDLASLCIIGVCCIGFKHVGCNKWDGPKAISGTRRIDIYNKVNS